MKKLICILCLMGCLSSHAQKIISLEGPWDFAIGDEESSGHKAKDNGIALRQHYNDYVMLPGSMLTNGKGTPVSVNTQWTGSLYDSSYYFNPRMEKYRQEGQMKFPFFLTPEKHYVGAAWYRKKVYVPKDWKGSRMPLSTCHARPTRLLASV